MSHIKSFSQFHAINEGTWAFKSDRQADQLIEELGAIKSPKELNDAFYGKWWNIVGDDTMYDFLDDAQEGSAGHRSCHRLNQALTIQQVHV